MVSGLVGPRGLQGALWVKVSMEGSKVAPVGTSLDRTHIIIQWSPSFLHSLVNASSRCVREQGKMASS